MGYEFDEFTAPDEVYEHFFTHTVQRGETALNEWEMMFEEYKTELRDLDDRKLDEIQKLESGLKRASGTVKMKLIKTLVNKMNCMERPVYYISNGGNNFIQIPSRSFFRENYDKIDLQFDYHVKFQVSSEEENNNN